MKSKTRESVDFDNTPFSFRYSPSAHQMLQAALELANRRNSNTIYSETLYYGVMFVAIKPYSEASDPVFQFLRAVISESGQSGESIEQELLAYAKGQVLSLDRKEVSFGFGTFETPPSLSPNAASILECARDLAVESSEGEIDTRHLVGGMLLSRWAGHEPHARRQFTRGGQSLAVLKHDFFGVVSSRWPNERRLWARELGIDPREEPPVSSPEMEDPLIEQLLARRLAVSTLAVKDAKSAMALINGPSLWGLGPEISRGDLILIYFPKTLAKRMRTGGHGPQKPGIRFLLRAGSHSLPAGDGKSYRQQVSIADSIELQAPIDLAEFIEPPLEDWSLARQKFRRAGQEEEPLAPEVARALWTLILDRNPEQRWEVQALLELEARPSKPETSFVMRNVLARDTWTTEDELGYSLYAQAITDSIFNGSSVPPLTIGIQAPWGQGKTSLMRMIQQRFDPEAPERDLRNLESNGETAVAATYGHLRDWLKQAAVRKQNACARTPPTGSDKSSADTVLQEGGTRDDANVSESPSPAREPWQTEDIDNLIGDRGPGGRYRRPGLLINERRRIPTVWFNPLYYGTTEQIWAGLAHAMLQQLSSQLENPIEREEFWFRLQLRRINVDAVLRDLRKAFWLRVVPMTAGYAAIGIVALLVAMFQDVWALLGVVGAAGAASYHGWLRKQASEKTWSLERQFERYVSEPDYRSDLGLLHWVDHDLDRALDLLCGDYPVAVFIDDLDRCDPKIVAEIIFAINQFLSLPRRNVFFFLGMDSEMVAAALEKARGMGREPPTDYAEAHQSFGWRFMEKFIQLPFVIPHLDDETAKSFAAGRLGGSMVDQETGTLVKGEDPNDSEPPPEETEDVIGKTDEVQNFEELAQLAQMEKQHARNQEERTKVQQAISKKATELLADPESEEITRIVQVAIEDLELNPRSITRYFGAVRILRNLQLATSTLSEPERDRMLVLRAAHLLLNWPETLQWLQRQREIRTLDGKWVPAISGLEALVAQTEDWVEWSAMWDDKQPTPLPPAFRDHRLFDFLKKIGDRPPGLSDMYDARFI